MFREIRRKKNELCPEAAKDLLKNERRGVLAVLGDGGYPYAVPLNYLYSEENEKIYFHGARVGHKADAIARCDKVCFTVYGGESRKDGEWAPYMQSAVVFGRCRRIEEQDAALALCRKFACKYYPDEHLADEELARSGWAVSMYEIEIEHLSGKLVQER